MKTALEILNAHIDFSKDGVIEREEAIKAMEEYALQEMNKIGIEMIEYINKQLKDEGIKVKIKHELKK